MSRRCIYTNFGAIACEPWAKKESWLTRFLHQSSYRSFDFHHSPQAEVPEGLQFSSVELYLLSRIEDDTNRLLSLSWAYDFDPFWADAVASHVALYNTIYKGHHPIRRLFLGDCSKNTAAKQHIEQKLNRLKDIHHWATVTEGCYSVIYKTRYSAQRSVFNALERERYLAGAVEAVEDVRAKVPAELEQKVMSELDLHLVNLRHWFNDCPNAKRTFTRRLA